MTILTDAWASYANPICIVILLTLIAFSRNNGVAFIIMSEFVAYTIMSYCIFGTLDESVDVVTTNEMVQVHNYLASVISLQAAAGIVILAHTKDRYYLVAYPYAAISIIYSVSYYGIGEFITHTPEWIFIAHETLMDNIVIIQIGLAFMGVDNAITDKLFNRSRIVAADTPD